MSVYHVLTPVYIFCSCFLRVRKWPALTWTNGTCINICRCVHVCAWAIWHIMLSHRNKMITSRLHSQIMCVCLIICVLDSVCVCAWSVLMSTRFEWIRNNNFRKPFRKNPSLGDRLQSFDCNEDLITLKLNYCLPGERMYPPSLSLPLTYVHVIILACVTVPVINAMACVYHPQCTVSTLEVTAS